MAPETCSYHGQFDNEIKQLLQESAETRADVRNLIYAVDRVEKALDAHMKSCNERIEKVEKEQSNQQVANAKQDGKINFLWSFLIDKNGLILIGVLAYVVLNKAW